MIRLGLRLTLGGGREAAARLVITAAAVALGVGLLLSSLAGINAVNIQNGRYAWLSTGTESPSGGTGSGSGTSAPGTSAPGTSAPGTSAPGAGSGHAGQPSPAAGPLWWLLRPDYFRGQLIGRIDVAATGPRSPVPPGIARHPGPGQYDASPALSRLLRSVPAAELGARFPGRQVGTIGPAALPSPDSLLVIVGHRARQLAHQPGAVRVTSIVTVPPSSCNGPNCLIGVGIDSNGIDLVLSAVAAGLLFPVLIFIGTASRLSAARREQRFAAMRLAGATPRQISVISAVESAVAAVAGAAGGFALFYALRTVIAAIPFTGASFFTSDLMLSPADILAVALGVPLAGVVAARIALRRVQISPLGVTRRVTPAAPRAWRLIPLLLGVGDLAVFVVIGRPGSTGGQIQAFLPGFLLILAGLIIAGPWLTMVGACTMARHARRPAALIAARRLADNPRAGFRAVSGLILALFVTSVSVGVIGTMAYNRSGQNSGADSGAAANTVVDQFGVVDQANASPVGPIPATVLARLRSVSGVTGVTEIRTNPLGTRLSFGKFQSNGPTGLVTCAQLARIPLLGRCPAGAPAVAVPPGGLRPSVSGAGQAATTWPAVVIPARQLQRLTVQAIAVTTNGPAASAKAQTVLEEAYPFIGSPATVAEMDASNSSVQTLGLEQQLADVVIIASLPIAGCALAASVAAGLSERQRPFSLLRLTGAPLGVLRRVVALESVVPLLTVAVASIGIGLLAAQLFLKSQLGYSLQPPGAGYYGLVLAGLAVALAIIAATLPLLKRITGPEVARND
ncbi:MAG: FtsX-like permease family protein [Streptosporangiaceae bacterium]